MMLTPVPRYTSEHLPGDKLCISQSGHSGIRDFCIWCYAQQINFESPSRKTPESPSAALVRVLNQAPFIEGSGFHSKLKIDDSVFSFVSERKAGGLQQKEREGLTVDVSALTNLHDVDNQCIIFD